MKRFFVICVLIFMMLILPSCVNGKNTGDETDVSSEVTSEITSGYDEQLSYKYDMESLSIEYKEPDIDVPYAYDEFENYISLPSYDDEKTVDSKIEYYSGNKKLFHKTLNEKGEVSNITVYEDDGTTEKTTIDFLYNTDLTTDISINYNENGSVVRREKFSYYQNGVLKSLYLMKYTDDSATPIIDAYEYNTDGSVKSYLDSDSFNQLLLEAVLGGLEGVLS